jgi:hypothetical protein
LANTTVGRYRLVATGKSLFGGTTQSNRLESQPFKLNAPASIGAAATGAWKDGNTLALQLRYPPNPSLYEADSPSGNYRLRDPESSPQEGALAMGGEVKATVIAPSGAEQQVTFTYDAAARAHVTQVSGAAPGLYRVTIAAGAATDGEGNTNQEPISLSLTYQ